jgi:hypothetical protein
MVKTPESYLQTNNSENIRYQEKLKKYIQRSCSTVPLNLINHSSTLMRFFIYNIMTDVVKIQQLGSKEHALIDLYRYVYIYIYIYIYIHIYLYIYDSVDSVSYFWY